MKVRENLLIVLLLFAAVMVCYSNVLNAGFVWDDEYLVVNNPLVRAPLWSFQIFKQDILSSNFTNTIYYRPIQMLSYAVDYRLWGMNPFFFHFVSIFLHFLNSILVFFLTCKLVERKAIGLITALIFAIHPAYLGVVSYISGRADVLSFLFGFLFMLFFILFKEKRKGRFLAAAAGCLCLAVLSKEAALIFPVLLLSVDFLILRRKFKFNFLPHLLFFSITGIYLLSHFFLFNDWYSSLSGVGSIAEKFLAYFTLVKEFLVLSIFPFGLHMRRSFAASGEMFLPVAVIVTCIIFFLFYLKNIRRMLLFSLIFFLSSLVPLIFVTNYFKVIAGHWLYGAGYGIFLFMSLVLVNFAKKEGFLIKGTAIAVLVGTVVLYSSGAIDGNKHWQSDVSLSEQVLKDSPGDMMAMHFRAASFMKKGDKEQMLDGMEKYTDYHSMAPRAWSIRGRLSLEAGAFDTAETCFKRALALDPNYDNAYFGLGLLAFRKEDSEGGIKYLEKVVEVNSKHYQALLMLGTAYSKTGDSIRALKLVKKANGLNPYDYTSLVNLGTEYTRQGKLQEGAGYYLKAAGLYPEKPLAFYNLGYVFHLSGLEKAAQEYLRKTLMVDPKFKPALELLSKIKNSETVKQ